MVLVEKNSDDSTGEVVVHCEKADSSLAAPVAYTLQPFCVGELRFSGVGTSEGGWRVLKGLEPDGLEYPDVLLADADESWHNATVCEVSR